MRPAWERFNSTLKKDLKIPGNPRVLNAPSANILTRMATIVLLLKRAFSFIVKIANQIRKLYKTNDPAIKEKLKPPFIPNQYVTLYNWNNHSTPPKNRQTICPNKGK